jgi:hypothetical protein
VKIAGTVKGSAATVKGSEHGTFTPPGSTRQYTFPRLAHFPREARQVATVEV